MRLKYSLLINLALILLFVYLFWFVKSPSNNPKIKDGALRGISGLEFSVRNKNLIWVHNDHGRKGRVFLIDKNGFTRATFKWDSWIRDWEDITIDPGSMDGKPYIYVGDIGDNSADHPFIYIYRFPEPLIDDEKELQNVQTITLKYPDGSRDAEAMFADPVSKQLYIITKREDQVGIYNAPLSMRDGDTVLLKKVGKLSLEGTGLFKWVTSADISRDGSQIVIRSYHDVFYWKRSKGQSVEQALRQKPAKLPHHSELQGEAIGFTPDGKEFYTIGEGKTPFLYENPVTPND